MSTSLYSSRQTRPAVHQRCGGGDGGDDPARDRPQAVRVCSGDLVVDCAEVGARSDKPHVVVLVLVEHNGVGLGPG